MEAMGADEAIPLKVKLQEIQGEKHIEYKNIFHLTFSMNFSCNLTIPKYVGLGKGVSVGFGIVKDLGDSVEIEQEVFEELKIQAIELLQAETLKIKQPPI